MTPDNGQVQIQFSEKDRKALLETPKQGMQNKTRWGEAGGGKQGLDERWSGEGDGVKCWIMWVCQQRGKVGQSGGLLQRVGMLNSPVQLYKLFHQPLASSLFFPYTPPLPPCRLWCPLLRLLLPANSKWLSPPRPQRWSVITTNQKGSFLLLDNLHVGKCFHCIV